jgi:hypothetical protein
MLMTLEIQRRLTSRAAYKLTRVTCDSWLCYSHSIGAGRGRFLGLKMTNSAIRLCGRRLKYCVCVCSRDR